MSVSMTIYLIFVKMIAQIVLISMNFNDLIRHAKIKNNRNGKKIPKFMLQTCVCLSEINGFPSR